MHMLKERRMAQKSENGAKVTPLTINEVKPGWSGDDDRYAKSLVNHLTLGLAKDMYSATAKDKFNAVILSVRTAMIRDWISTQQQYYLTDAKRVYYLSMEFLLGRLLNSYLINLGLTEQYRQALGVLDIEFEEVLDNEWDAALGNGGLGRLAACYLDSMATLRYPCYGYGIRYEYGIFSQRIKDGYQSEAPDNWLRYGNFWEFPRAECCSTRSAFTVASGTTRAPTADRSRHGSTRTRYSPWRTTTRYRGTGTASSIPYASGPPNRRATSTWITSTAATT